ncbi:MAG: hypothetical protein FKY71_11365 [Spiribacter salinus]|uniref:Uncharacterized protein n=1 Tax=Spiribacter salinus TaxID=1335746 RepID=A0A540VQ55_9GAMM|nr:MAG: hypothetical protein FKY71_11365 [Spiribacter salinus]
MTYLYISGGTGAEHKDLIQDLRAEGRLRIRNSDYATAPERRATVVYTDNADVADMYEGRAEVHTLVHGGSVKGLLQRTGAGWFDVTVEGQTEKVRGEKAAFEKAEDMGANDIELLD